MGRDQTEDWAEIVDDVVRGDRVAFLKLSRLVTGFLARWRAFDFRNDWDDFAQEVILATIDATRRNRIRDPRKVYGYIRTAARHKFVDRIRSRKREAPDINTEEIGADPLWANPDESPFQRTEVWDAVERLPERQREAVVHVYVKGMTYNEAEEATGIPLGTLKRDLRHGLQALREELDDDDDADAA